MSEVSTILDTPTTDSSPELVTSVVTAAITTGSPISTHTVITASKKKNSEEPSPSSSSATASTSPSELSAEHTIAAAPVETKTTCINHLHQSPVTVCPHNTSAPSATTPLDLAKPSPHSNSSMGIVIVSKFIHHKPEGALGLIPLLRIGVRSSDAQEEEGIPGPQQLPSSDLKRLFLQMQDNRVQHLIRAMRDLMTKGEIIPRRKLRATSLQLLRALNLPEQPRKSKRSMKLKR
ncbi:hypothetical protein JRQ81_015332 [Phrynocephalus forsythii]|uniref:Uncharacterized protein n=1 Tax=Phrynocephalus forsythii TaxID=171643 RepID=A0A9Q0XTS1_9SAUR|nr:hypothetical protein JRQ81_015332 [Phrynocephalus forsythii]